MNDKEANAQKKRIRYLVDKWVKQLGLGWWHITYEWTRESVATDVAPYESSANHYVLMTTESDGNYMSATITVYLPNIAEVDDDLLEHAFVHELMHIFVSPMRTKEHAGDEERVCTLLSKAFIWAVDLVPKKARELKRGAKKKHVKKSKGHKK